MINNYKMDEEHKEYIENTFSNLEKLKKILSNDKALANMISDMINN